jgi:hypothetical protein
LYGTWEVSFVPGRHAGPIHEGMNRTMNMYADEKSDKAIVPKKLPNEEGDSSDLKMRVGPPEPLYRKRFHHLKLRR